MMRIARGVLAVVALVGLAGCWPVPGHDANRTNFNDLETRITPANAGTLTRAWAVTEQVSGFANRVRDPVVSVGGVHVVWNGCLVAAYRPSDGSRRWLTNPNPTLCANGPALGAGSAFVVGDQVRYGSWLFQPGPTGGTFLPGGATLDAATGEIVEAGTSDLILIGVRDGFTLSIRPGLGADGLLVRDKSIVVAPLDGDGPTTEIDTPRGSRDWPLLGDHAVFQAGSGTLATIPGDPATGDGVRAFSRTRTRPHCGDMTCPLWATPIVNARPPVLSPDQSMVYVTSPEHFYALDAATGAVRSTLTFPDTDLQAPPALANGILYVVTFEGALYAIDANACAAGNCSIKWRFGPTGRRTSLQPVVAGGVVFVGDEDGFVYAVDAATGNGLWQDTWPAMMTGLAVSNGQLYVGTSDGYLLAYRPTPP